VHYGGENCETVRDYHEACRRYGLHLMEQAFGTSSHQPLWGKAKDPVTQVKLIVAWSSTQEAGQIKPILQIPPPTRFKKKRSQRDQRRRNQSIDETMPDPYTMPADFRVNVTFLPPKETPRRVNLLVLLASLIRTSVLPSKTTASQMLDSSILEEWSHPDMESRTIRVVNAALEGEMSRRVVQALNWGILAETSMKTSEVEDLLKTIFDPIHTLRFPEPPSRTDLSDHELIFQPLLKSAPIGRLLSTLFVKMASLKSPSSMAVVWHTFVQEMRRRWETKESLPNMNYVPGLDLSAEELSRSMRCVSSIGVKADNSAFLHSSEPDPDHQHCLIGQKMQVFNLGIESMVAMEMYQSALLEQQQQLQQKQMQLEHDEQQTCPSEDADSAIIWTDQNGEAFSVHVSDDDDDDEDDEDLNFDFSGALMMDARSLGETRSLAETMGTSKYDFFDAAQSMAGHTNAFDDDRSTASALIPANVNKRKGARCPVHGLNLVENQDQVYAPYLQRPHPLTDDIIHERKLMLSQHWKAPNRTSKKTLQFRIGVAQRLQKPKLLSDMCSFQSANPGALFSDFVNWYGNPGNPLEEYIEEETKSPQLEDMHKKSVGVKMDLASEAIQILNATRDFWTTTWEEASPVAAIDQDPLFDVEVTVEKVLASFEEMHPAELMNQIMAVNLSMSYFSLIASARDTESIGIVRTKLLDLRKCVQHALRLLSQDIVRRGKTAKLTGRFQIRYSSIETIRACEKACTMIGEAESLLARGMSLLHKFPSQYDLIQEILRRSNDHSSYELHGEEAQAGILGVIHKHQEEDSMLPRPSMREYVMRNVDEGLPCQLSLRYAESGPHTEDSGVILGLLTNRM